MVIDLNNSINSNNSTNSTNSARSRSTAPATGGNKSPAAPVESGNVSKNEVVLSQEAQRLTRLQDNINNLPDVDTERVASIKKAIAEGRFEINPERIAENMLNQDELLG